MSKGLSTLASQVKNAYDGNDFVDVVGGGIADVGKATGINSLTNAGNNLTDSANAWYGSSATPGQPTAPGVDPGVSAAQNAQLQQAQSFRSNLGTNEQNAYQNLAQGANQQLGQTLKNVNTQNSARGMAYGGINQGQQQQARATEQNSLAQGRENINDQYNTAANQLDASAIGTGVAVQQSQQAIQNQIYQQALQNMQNQNGAFGQLLQGGAMIAMLA